MSLIGCPPLTNCGPHPACNIESTTTIKVPAKDICCPLTPTSVVPGPCPTCPTGCDVSTVTAYVTTTADYSSIAKRQLPVATCFTTLWKSDALMSGPTSTYYPLTVTQTILQRCNGCDIVTRNLNGIGPQISFKTTVTNP